MCDICQPVVSVTRIGSSVREHLCIRIRVGNRSRVSEKIHRLITGVQSKDFVAVVIHMPAAPNDQAIASKIWNASTPRAHYCWAQIKKCILRTVGWTLGLELSICQFS